ncbi:MAG: IS200/IS605 family accessory protein TnpB-related protein [Crocosphaera sp.]
MTLATYSTKAPEKIDNFLTEVSQLFSGIERQLYRDIQRERPLKQLKKDYQILYGIKARQFNSIRIFLQGKINSRNECCQSQIKDLEEKIKPLKKSIKKLTNRVKIEKLNAKKTASFKRKDYPACSLDPRKKTPRGQSLAKLHYKKRKLHRLQAKLNYLKNHHPKLIFGSRKLWQAQLNLEANGYVSHEQWLKDWQNRRHHEFNYVGSKDEKAGCQNCQLTADGTLAITIPPCLIDQYQHHPNYQIINRTPKIVIENVYFPYGQETINWALDNQQALSYRFVHKKDRWYIFVTTEQIEVPYQSHSRNGAIGIDFNPNCVGWAYIDSEGNLRDKGQIRFNLADRSTEQTTATLGDVCKVLGDLAIKYQCPIAIEKLDFQKKKRTLGETSTKYARMLSNFAYSKFHQVLASRCERMGIELISLNPAYSSLIGMTKFMSMYGLDSSMASGLVLARRALRLSERLPSSAKSALLEPVEDSKHVWSLWRKYQKKCEGKCRHRFFSSKDANSVEKVTLSSKSVGLQVGVRSKPIGTFSSE